MNTILRREFSFEKKKLKGKKEGGGVIPWDKKGSITVPGATAFLEWKFINNAELDNKKNSPAVSHCSALSKGRAISLKSQKKTNYETQIILGDFSLSGDSVGCGQIIQTATLPKLWGLLIRWNNNGIHAKLLTSCCCFKHLQKAMCTACSMSASAGN